MEIKTRHVVFLPSAREPSKADLPFPPCAGTTSTKPWRPRLSPNRKMVHAMLCTTEPKNSQESHTEPTWMCQGGALVGILGSVWEQPSGRHGARLPVGRGTTQPPARFGLNGGLLLPLAAFPVGMPGYLLERGRERQR